MEKVQIAAVERCKALGIVHIERVQLCELRSHLNQTAHAEVLPHHVAAIQIASWLILCAPSLWDMRSKFSSAWALPEDPGPLPSWVPRMETNLSTPWRQPRTPDDV